MKKNNTIKISKFLVVGIVFLFALIIFRIISIGTFTKIDGLNIKNFASKRDIAKEKIRATRGTIYDRNGEVLARNVNSYTVIAYLNKSRTTNPEKPQHVMDKKVTAKKLAPILDMKESSLLKLLNSKSYQVELGPGGRGISELVKEEISALELPGIDFTTSTKRYYPYGNFLSYTLGYAKSDEKTGNTNGELGLELKYNDLLNGKDGYREYTKDIYGYPIANTKPIEVDPVDGKDLYLTIDANLQLFVEQAVGKFERVGEDWITITAADAKTGEILATASDPNFNPNKKDIKNYYDPLVSYAYEPGSTMKIYSFMAAMENGLYNGSDKYKSGTIKVDDFKIKDWNNYGWGTISYDNGFLASSNTAATRLGFKLGRDKLMDFYKKVGFGGKTGIDLPNELAGKLAFKYKSEVATASFGQGLLTTPIQNIQALTVVANDGTLIKPSIINKITDPSTKEVVKKNIPVKTENVVSKATVDKMKNLMYGVVNEKSIYPTGKSYAVNNLNVIGKTGTAEIASKGGYKKGTFIKSFSSIFPKEDPQILLYISVNNVKDATKIPTITKSLIEDISKYKAITSKEEPQNTKETIKIDSYKNKSSNDVKNYLKAKGLNPIVIGDGEKVIKQYPEKGKKLNDKDKVFLLTNSNKYKMANMKGWSVSEINNFGNLIDLSFNINGYGYCISQSLKPGSKVDVTKKVDVTLKPKYAKK